MTYSCECECCGYTDDSWDLNNLPEVVGNCNRCTVEMCSECPSNLTDTGLDLCDECYQDFLDDLADEPASGVDADQDTLPWGSKDEDHN